jgi:polyhydroxyalkanoate synthesis repressor PhaR
MPDKSMPDKSKSEKRLEPRIVKRYANRKLYDTERSRYVTLDEIGEMVRSGMDVRIIDNNTKEDLTSVTMAQILVEKEKRKGLVPLDTMRELIQTSGESLHQLAGQLRDASGKVGERVGRVFRRGEGGSDSPGADPGGAGGGSHASLRDFLEGSQRAVEDWQKRVDERVRGLVEGLSPLAGLQKDVQALTARVAELEREIERLKSQNKG